MKKPLKLIRDNATRWLSQLHMIRRALRLRPYLTRTIFEYNMEWTAGNFTSKGTMKAGRKMPRVLLPEGHLSDSDWLALERLVKILSYYETVVKILEGDGQVRRRRNGFEGSYGNIWDVILGMEEILGVLEKEKLEVASFPEPEQLRIGINLAWEKLNKYYNSRNFGFSSICASMLTIFFARAR